MKDLGPLNQLIGTWKGSEGIDVFITPFGEKITTEYEETMTFEAIPPTKNPPFQTEYGLRYTTVIHELKTGKPMHQETGYWLIHKDLLGWDGYTIIRVFSIPHGIAIMAGGHIKNGSTQWTVRAHAGDPCYGILNNHYLETAAKTTEFTSHFEINGNTLSYSEISSLDFGGLKTQPHSDSNTLTKQA